MKKILRNMRIRTQLMTAFLIVTVVTLAVLLMAIISVRDLVDVNSELNQRVISPLEFVRNSSLMIEMSKRKGATQFCFGIHPPEMKARCQSSPI